MFEGNWSEARVAVPAEVCSRRLLSEVRANAGCVFLRRSRPGSARAIMIHTIPCGMYSGGAEKHARRRLRFALDAG